MDNYLTAPNRQVNPDGVLKATSLIYLKDALLAQEYENCAELIAKAKSFGARQREISAVLAQSVRPLNAGRNQANQKRKSSPRF